MSLMGEGRKARPLLEGSEYTTRFSSTANEEVLRLVIASPLTPLHLMWRGGLSNQWDGIPGTATLLQSVVQ